MSLAATCSYIMFLKWLFSDISAHDLARHKECLDALARCRCCLKASVWESRRGENDLSTTDRGICTFDDGDHRGSVQLGSGASERGG